MNDPIKPPGGPTAPPSPDRVDEAGATGPEGASSTFRQTLDRTASAERAADASSATASDPVAQVAADIRTGRIDIATAIDRLVDRALSSVAAGVLPPARRTELEAHLRRLLAEDPTLGSLTRDLERAD